MFLSVVIPCYNESRRLVKNLDIKISYLKSQKYSWEIVLVDDGSSDNTKKLAQNIIKKYPQYNIRLISYQKNQGKGYAVKTGMLKAKGDYRLFTDLDNSTDIKEIEKMLLLVKKYDVIIASRYLAKSKISKKQSFIRRLISRGGNFFIRIIIGLPYKDTQCGFKLFKQEAVKKIFSKALINRWGFDIEILLIAKYNKLKIKEVPVAWHDEADSKLNPIKAGWAVFLETIKIKYNFFTGKYK